MAIPQSFIQDLVARADVVEIVGRHVQLRKAGANYQGLCPFHSEKSPSFTVSPSKQFYHCFGCGKNGNAIGFLMEHTGMHFVEAVKDLAQQYGMQVPDDDVSPQERARAAEQRQRQATLTDVLEKAGDAWRHQLRQAPRAIEYLKGRGLSGEVARRFGLGYAPPGWRGLASVFPDYSDALLVDGGLVISSEHEAADGAAGAGGDEKRYDRFRDRIMFPIRNVKGECIGFGGRVLGDDKPKYLNSPETPVFSKGRELYGLFEARTAIRELGYVLVTEGYMDVVALAQLGFPNAVATLGTACTPEHVHKLFRFTDAVVFSFDGDAAGRRAARKALDGALPYATDVRSIKFLFLPAEHDPDSYIRAHGNEAFARCVSEATPLSRFLVDAAREGCDLDSAEGRAHMASNAAPLWRQMPDGALKRQLLGEIAGLVQLAPRELETLWAPPRHNSAGAAGATGAGTAQRRSNPWEARRHGSRTEAPMPDFDAVDWAPPRRGAVRALPASRADHAARLFLAHSQAWDLFTTEDHALLCALPEPHGTLFTWLEQELHEHGCRPWGALREGLRGHPAEALAMRLLSAAELVGEEHADDTRQELRNLMRRIWVEHLKEMETAAIAAANTDPTALQRYRTLQARRRALEQSPLSPS